MKTHMKWLLVLICAAVSLAAERQNLNGDWILSGGNDEISLSDFTGKVPGGVFSDLTAHGDISDIFYGTRDANYSWVGTSTWKYRAQFTVEEDLLAHRVVTLVFEGVDTFATITLNGNTVGTTENMFVRYVFSVKDFLQVGYNELSVTFESAVNKAAALAADPSNQYVVPPECPDLTYNGICHVNRIRKMQASFSWDWGPAFASVGIWRDVYLEAYDDGAIDYVVATPVKNPDADKWTLLVTTYFSPVETDNVKGTLKATLNLGDDEITASVDVEQYPNEYSEILLTTSLEVSSDLINLWWPNGWGEPNLYNLTVEFTGENDQDERTVRVGFRTVELVQETLDSGINFYFKVNGYPMFARGANEIPLSILPEKGQDPQIVKSVLQTARDTHMNMLRIWGGGVYESDYFYDLADEYGLLIWQDFMFACAMYPTDEAFLNNVATEVRHQVRRLGSHPSIAIWAGNNENEGALRDNWYGTGNNFDLYKSDYIKLYVDLIETEVHRILPNSPFVTSSPSDGLETDRQDHVADWPGNPLYGDVHFYDYNKDNWDVSTFPTARFSSEYGYQSMPSVEAWWTATDNWDNLYPDSDFLNYRQHHPQGNEQNLNLINIQLQLPDRSSENYVQTFIYLSQISQAQAIKVETEHYRSFKGRLDNSGQGDTMGALYWQLNDVWVAPTWSGMDFTGRWKMLQYFSQDFFNPMIVTGRLNNNNLEVYAVLDDLKVPDIEVKALVHIYKWDSLDPLVAVEFPVTLDTTKAVLVTTINAPEAFNSAGCGSDYNEAKKTCFFHLHLIDKDGNHLVPFNYVFAEKLRYSYLANANVQISSITAIIETSNEFEIVVTTDAVALFVWLDSHNIRGRFSENGFLHVLPTKTVYFWADEPTTVEDLTSHLTITHLRDPKNL